MTSIVSLLAGPFVQLAADRLVTVRRGPGAPAIHDPESNKLLVVVARDGVAAIGYTGIAYVGGLPTDMFIANHLAGRDLAGMGTIMVGTGLPYVPALGEAVVGLIRKLEASTVGTDLSPNDPAVLLAGWRWREHNGRNEDRGTFAWVIHRRVDGRYVGLGSSGRSISSAMSLRWSESTEHKSSW